MASKVFSVVLGLAVVGLANLSWADSTTYRRITVSSSADGTDSGNGCTLRAAVYYFNTDASGHHVDNGNCTAIADTSLTANEIDIPYNPASQIALTPALNAIVIASSQPLSIVGSYYLTQSANVLAVVRPQFDSNGNLQTLQDAIFNIASSAAVNISYLSLQKGRGRDGGAINSVGTNLTLTRVEIRDAVATGTGSAIYSSDGNLTLDRALIYNNTDTSTVKNGAAVYQKNNKLTLISTLIANNGSGLSAGGIYADNADLDLNFATLAYNYTSDSNSVVAGFVQTGSKSLIVTNSVIAHNVLSNSATFDLGQTNPVGECESSADVSAIFASYNYILNGNSGRCASVFSADPANNSKINDPKLGPLNRYSFSSLDASLIVAPAKDSPLIDGSMPPDDASNRACKKDSVLQDARGIYRINSDANQAIQCASSTLTGSSYDNCVTLHKQKGPKCDIGAIESRGAPIGVDGSLTVYRASTDVPAFDPTLALGTAVFSLSESVPDISSCNSLQILSQPTNGKVETGMYALSSTDATQVCKVKYTASAGFVGKDSFTYAVKDYNGYSATPSASLVNSGQFPVPTAQINIQVDGDKTPKGGGGSISVFGLLGLALIRLGRK